VRWHMMKTSCFKKKRSKLSSELRKIKKDLKRKSNENTPLVSLQGRQIIEEIRLKTKQLNINNVTRTQAYLDFYERFPGVRWAFIGHMVSRNGGWNMTDLKGDLLSKLLSEEEQKNFFNFLERGNWLIFHDIYPQMLLYEKCLKTNTNLFYLLSQLDVSIFMEVIWNHFLKTENEYLLAIALVINEQSYLEKRVINNSYYQKTVLKTIEFKLQEILNLNQILFPYQNGNEIKLVGQTIDHFASLHERILLGKRLYQLLFCDGNLDSIFNWAKNNPHTGSRKDFWPSLFNDINETSPGDSYKRRTEQCKLRPGSSRIYSPKLMNAWDNVDHRRAEIGDWYSDWKALYYLQPDDQVVNGEIRDEYCETLEKIELAILAKEKLF
jgi:hypothetical protein